MLDGGCVKELIAATGGKWGGTNVDNEYLGFIECLIGNSVKQHLKEKNQNHIFYEMIRDFENAKRTIKPQSDMKFYVRIPHVLNEAYEEVHPGEKLRSKQTVLTKRNKQVSVSFAGEKLRLDSNDAEDFFTESTESITNHLKKLLKKNKKGRGISTIILVGGFAESHMLIHAIKHSFPEKRVIIPKEAAWSVLRGAVIFGHDPSLIKERRSKYTYGIRIWKIFDSSIHDEKYKYVKNGQTRCGSLFDKLITIDEVVIVREYQQEKFFTMEEIGEMGNLCLYTSLSENPKYVDEVGCSFVGYILHPGHNFALNETIHVMMRFGETEIEVKAEQPSSGQTRFYYLGQK